MGIQEKDYLKRQLAQLARVLARVLGFKEAGRIDEARAELEKGARETFGTAYGPLSRVDVGTAVGLLRSRESAEAYAQFLECEAGLDEAQGDADRAAALRRRAAQVRDAAGKAGG